LRALGRLRANGIDVGINVMPVLPGITDAPEQIEAVVAAVARQGASRVRACSLRLQSAARQRYLPFIAEEFPELAGRYESTYAHSPEVGDRYREGLRSSFARVCAKHGVPFERDYPSNELASEAEGATQLAMDL
jgi:DNA repair photolyase